MERNSFPHYSHTISQVGKAYYHTINFSMTSAAGHTIGLIGGVVVPTGYVSHNRVFNTPQAKCSNLT